jgi:hypothetical protein
MRTYQRNGSWCYAVEVGRHPVTNKRITKKVGGFAREKDAKAAALKLMNDLQIGHNMHADRISFGELSDVWLNHYTARNQVKNSTIRVRQHERNVWLKHFDKIPVESITRKMIQDALNQLRTEYADNTLSGIFATLKMILKMGIEMGHLKQNPAEFCYIPKIRKSLEEIEKETVLNTYMEKDALKRFLTAAREHGFDQDYALFLTLAYTGMRIGEMLALKWKDINFEEQSISITKTMYNPTNNTKQFKLETPKTASSKRVINVDGKVLDELRKLRTEQKKLRLVRKEYQDFDFVFINYAHYPGWPLPNKQATIRMKRLLKLAELNADYTLHSFRHTHTSLLAEAGVGLVEIMERLGHKDDSITREIYLHVTKELKKEAAQKFSKLMSDL